MCAGEIYRADSGGISQALVCRKGYLYKVLAVLTLCLLSLCLVPVVKAADIVAMPDYGRDECISFKRGIDTNPLSYPFGYACVSRNYCEVFSHSCDERSCDTDYSKGTRTTMTIVPMLTTISEILMAPAGVALEDKRSQWCLIRDGTGGFWALDKWRGISEKFSGANLIQTVVPCKSTDLFSSQSGCVVR